MRQRRVRAALGAFLIFAGTMVFSVGAQSASTPAQAQGSSDAILFVVDTSGSMRGSKLSAAKTAITSTVDALGGSHDMGLREFSGGCSNPGDLLIPVGPVDSAAFDAEVAALTAGGGTPTSAALELAATELPPGGTIILIADGDDQCGNLCTTAQSIADRGFNITLHAVGVQVGSSTAASMQCAAAATGGDYVDVTDLDNFVDTLVGVTLCAVDIVTCYAPEVRFHWDEDFFPMDASDFVAGSELKWAADVGCDDFLIKASPSTIPLGNGNYRSYESDGSPSLDFSWGGLFPDLPDYERCEPDDERRSYDSALFTRPFRTDPASNGVRPPLKFPGTGNDERLEDTEGFYLDWVETDRAMGVTPTPDTVDGAGRMIDAPVYFEQTATSITYWFFYGHDPKAKASADNESLIAIGDQILAHEGDWERITVRLVDGKADTVEYYGHGCNPPLVRDYEDEAELSGTHPIVYVAEGAHASYPAVRDSGPALCDGVKGASDEANFDDAQGSVTWRTWTGIGPVEASTQCWYGFGGAWGNTGNFFSPEFLGLGRTHDTGPVGLPFSGSQQGTSPCKSDIGNFDALTNPLQNFLDWLESFRLRFESAQPGEEYVFSVLSVPTILGEGVVDAGGVLEVDLTIPEGLPPGEHRLIAQNKATGRTEFVQLITVDARPECTVMDATAPELDVDKDLVVDACDPRLDDGPAADFDSDGVINAIDNCPSIPNADQATRGVARSVGAACDEALGVNTIGTHIDFRAVAGATPTAIATPPANATPTAIATPPANGAEFCPGTTQLANDALPFGGCATPTPTPAEFCPGTTQPAYDELPNGGCPTPTAVPTSTPAATAIPTAVPTFTPVPAMTPIAVAPPVPAGPFEVSTSGLDLNDPYTCGGGFAGSVSGGAAPYSIAYVLSGVGGTFDLGSFPVAGPGTYTSPPGFIDYSVVPDGDYAVHIVATDSSVPALTSALEPAFVARVTDVCAPSPAVPTAVPLPIPAPVPNPAPIPTPAPVATAVFVPAAPAPPVVSAPAPAAAGPQSGAVTVSTSSFQPKSVFLPMTATEAPAVTQAPAATDAPKALALTGASPLPLAQLGIALIAVGALLLAAPVRRPVGTRRRR